MISYLSVKSGCVDNRFLVDHHVLIGIKRNIRGVLTGIFCYVIRTKIFGSFRWLGREYNNNQRDKGYEFFYRINSSWKRFKFILKFYSRIFSITEEILFKLDSNLLWWKRQSKKQLSKHVYKKIVFYGFQFPSVNPEGRQKSFANFILNTIFRQTFDVYKWIHRFGKVRNTH